MNLLSQNDLAGNTLGTALELGWLDLNPTPRLFSEAVATSDLRDYYRFQVMAPGLVTLTLGGLSANANLFLQDASGNTLASSVNPGQGDESIAFSLAPGSYYALVRLPGQPTAEYQTVYQLTLSSQFITTDAVVSDPGTSLRDPEYDWLGDCVTWQDELGNLWVAPMDPQTGDFILEEAVLIDTGLAPISTSKNGPEWVYAQNDTQIVYTKLVDGNLYLGRARWTGTDWEAGLLEGTDPLMVGESGFLPFGSLAPSSDSPRIFYRLPLTDGQVTATGPYTLVWQDLEQGTKGTISESATIYSRWVDGSNSEIIFTMPVDDTNQVFRYDIDTDTLTQLTFDGTNKGEAFLWRAPEFNNEEVFFVGEQVNPSDTRYARLGIYRQISGVWTKVKTVQPPSDLPLIHSPEPFVYNGKSYISLLTVRDAATNPNQGLKGAEIWIAGIEPEVDFYRQVSNDGDIVINDPEPLVTEAGAFIYYAEIAAGGVRIIHQADTGLGLPDLAGNNLDTALDVGQLDLNPLSKSFSDTVSVTDDKDYYRFELEAPSNVKLGLDGLSANANLFLIDRAGGIVVRSANPGSTGESIDIDLEPGTYYALARSPQQSGYPSTPYNLTLSARFLVNDVVVSNPSISLPDPEFDGVGNRITWQDTEGNLWVAPVNPQSGDFILEEAMVIDTGLAPQNVTQGGTGNGPEWVYTKDGSEIIYTKLIDGDWVLGHAQWNGSQWEAGLLTDEMGQPVPGRLPFGSLNPEDEKPLINYARPDGQPIWRELDNPLVGGTLSGGGGRWVEGERAILRNSDVNGVRQTFKYEVDTGISTQLTFDNITKRGDAFMWNAPEFNYEQVLFTSEIDPNGPVPPPSQANQLGVHRQVDGQWTRIKTIVSPSAELPFIHSAESFVYNGKSYISMLLVKKSPGGEISLNGSQVWLVGIEPDVDFLRQISRDGNTGNNNDPEPFVTDGGAFVYYAEVIRGNRLIHKTDTGLGPPVAQYNEIFGTPAAEVLVGTAGSDRLIGGAGRDTLTGLGGGDLFAYTEVGDGRDTITDFAIGQDQLDLTQLFDSLGYQGEAPYQDGYVQIFNQGSEGGAAVRIDPDGNSGADPFVPLVLLQGVEASALLNSDSILF